MKKNKAEVFQPSGDVRRVQSLGGGRWVRIGDHLGKWHHFNLHDDVDAIFLLWLKVREVDAPLAERIAGELRALNADRFDCFDRTDGPS